MKNIRIKVLLISIIGCLSLVACNEKTSDTEKVSQIENKKNEEINKDVHTNNESENNKKELTQVRWVVSPSGNSLLEIAKDKGYFEEYGIEIVDVPIDGIPEQGASITSGKADIIANAGTSLPLQLIAAGSDVTIFGGHMATGAEGIIAKKGTKVDSVEDLIGKKVAAPSTTVGITGPLLELGYDPLTEIEWIDLASKTDNIAAVISGEADFATIQTQQIYAVSQNPEVEIVAYTSEFLPMNSCCRMTASSEYVNNNPETLKNVLKAVIRANKVYQQDKTKDYSSKVLADAMGTSQEHVKAFQLDPELRLSPDPITKQVKQYWEIMDATGYLDDNAKNINIDDHLNKDLYKQALDEVISEHGSEDTEYWNSVVEFYETYN